MTRQEIFDHFKIVNGRITSSGRFEGAKLYVPYFWGVVLDGLAEEGDDGIVTITIQDEDITQFPELTADGYRVGTDIRLCQRDDGFVCLV